MAAADDALPDVDAGKSDRRATFNQRFNANPQGFTAGWRQSTNIEDYRNKPYLQRSLEAIVRQPLSSLVEKVIHPFGYKPPARPSRFAGGQIGSEQMRDRMEDIHSEIDPTRSDLDRTLDPMVDRFNQGAPLQNVPVDNSANVDPVARPPGTMNRYEDIDE